MGGAGGSQGGVSVNNLLQELSRCNTRKHCNWHYWDLSKLTGDKSLGFPLSVDFFRVEAFKDSPGVATPAVETAWSPRFTEPLKKIIWKYFAQKICFYQCFYYLFSIYSCWPMMVQKKLVETLWDASL